MDRAEPSPLTVVGGGRGIARFAAFNPEMKLLDCAASAQSTATAPQLPWPTPNCNPPARRKRLPHSISVIPVDPLALLRSWGYRLADRRPSGGHVHSEIHGASCGADRAAEHAYSSHANVNARLGRPRRVPRADRRVKIRSTKPYAD